MKHNQMVSKWLKHNSKRIKSIKIMEDFYSKQKNAKNKKNSEKLKKIAPKKKKGKTHKNVVKRNQNQKIIFRNIKKIIKFFKLENQTSREMDFLKMVNVLNSPQFLQKSRTVLYPIDLYVEIKRHKHLKNKGMSLNRPIYQYLNKYLKNNPN